MKSWGHTTIAVLLLAAACTGEKKPGTLIVQVTPCWQLRNANGPIQITIAHSDKEVATRTLKVPYHAKLSLPAGKYHVIAHDQGQAHVTVSSGHAISITLGTPCD